MEKTVSQILQEVREKVDAGWTQHVMGFTDRLGREHHCLIGALDAVVQPDTERQALALLALAAALPKQSSRLMCSQRYALINFNDQHCSHKEQVLELIDRALTEVTK